MRFLNLLSVIAAAVLMLSAAAGAAPVYTLNFAQGYTGGPVDQWLRSRGFQLEKDAKDSRRLQLSIADDTLTLRALGKLRGFLLNDAVNLPRAGRVRIEWGINQYPRDVAYSRQINNEALMVYFFFGSEKISSGHILIPNSPYFIGLFLCQNDLVDHPYKGRYFHTGGRFVCLGKPKPGETVISEFDLESAFKRYFDKRTVPGITGVGLGVDTSASGNDGRAGAFIKRIEFLDDAAGG
jgi:hypothetical protein